MKEPIIYDLGAPGRSGVRMPDPDVPETPLPAELMRDELDLPEVDELTVLRHFQRLSHLNHNIESGFYPLGSCTMKYNPKLNEDVARLPGFAGIHPLQDESTVQGALQVMHEVQDWLMELGGFAGVSLQPAAGAHGEFAGILMMRKYHLDRGDTKRVKMLIPDSAHGTNPASTTMSGLTVVELPSDNHGNVDLEALREHCDDTVVGLMITNPNTLGLFEEHMQEVIDVVHGCGGLVYGDGANFNALMGIVRPGDMGFDVMHYNLHKTFSTPHGGGGPGSGPVGVSEALAPYLPGPIVGIVEEPESEEEYPVYGWVMPEKSIGRMKAFWGQFGMHVRALTYMLVYGGDGLRKVSEMAVLNANYVRVRLRDSYHIPHDRICMHEFVAEGRWSDAPEVQALDVSKRLMDYGIHPPTNYFPLIVHDALMIEPTETENKQTLDGFIEAMLQIAREAHEEPELLKTAPHVTPVGRLDEVRAAKQLVLCCRPIPEWAETEA
jgi:glycine dehydrogenase subunit 2